MWTSGDYDNYKGSVVESSKFCDPWLWWSKVAKLRVWPFLAWPEFQLKFWNSHAFEDLIFFSCLQSKMVPTLFSLRCYSATHNITSGIILLSFDPFLNDLEMPRPTNDHIESLFKYSSPHQHFQNVSWLWFNDVQMSPYTQLTKNHLMKRR